MLKFSPCKPGLELLFLKWVTKKSKHLEGQIYPAVSNIWDLARQHGNLFVCKLLWVALLSPFSGCLPCILYRWSSVNFGVLGSSWVVCITAFALFWHRRRMFLNLTQRELSGYRLDCRHRALRFSFYPILLHPTVMSVTCYAFCEILLIVQLNGLSMCVRSPICMKLLLPSSYSFSSQFQIDAPLELSTINWVWKPNSRVSQSLRYRKQCQHASSDIPLPLPGKWFWFLIGPHPEGSPSGKGSCIPKKTCNFSKASVFALHGRMARWGTWRIHKEATI